MKTVSALLAGAISELLDSGETVDAAAARELMGAARWGGPLDRMVMHGPLKELAAVTSEAVDARLARLRSARWSVFVPDDSDAATTLVVLLNVLLADDAALRVEQYYAQAARSAMVAAIIADLRGDGPGIDAARDELSAAARGALVCLASGTEIDAAPVVSASALVRAELRSRLRGGDPDHGARCGSVADRGALSGGCGSAWFVAAGPIRCPFGLLGGCAVEHP